MSPRPALKEGFESRLLHGQRCLGAKEKVAGGLEACLRGCLWDQGMTGAEGVAEGGIKGLGLGL